MVKPQQKARRNFESDDLVWVNEAQYNACIGNMSEAQLLARCMYNILRQMPTCMEDLDPMLEYEKLPGWLTSRGGG